MRLLSLFVVTVVTVVSLTAGIPAYGAILQVQDSSGVLQLNNLISEALDHNESLNAARLHAKAKRAVPPQVSTLPDPVIGVSYQPFPIYTARGFQRFQIRLEQEIPFPGKLELRKSIAEYSAVMAEYDVGIADRLLVYQVKVSYYELYRIQEQFDVIKEFRIQLSDLVTSTTARYKVGEGNQQDILKAQLERNKLDELELELMQRQLSESESLARLLNRGDGAELVAGAFSIEKQAEDSTNADSRSLKLEQRPELLAQKTALLRSEADIRLAEKMFLPDFTVGVNYYDIGASDLTPTMTGRNALGIQLKVKLPLWRSGLTARLTESRVRLQENDALLRDLQIEISTQVNRAAGQFELEKGTLQLYEKTLIPQAQMSLQASLSAYATGQADFMNLLDAERVLFSLRMSFLDSVSRTLRFSAALDWALGNPIPSGGNAPDNNASGDEN